MKPGDKYLKLVEWSEEDGCYIGSCPGLMLGGVHGDNEKKVYAELCEAVEEWIAGVAKDGVPLPPATAGRDYSGKFVIRVGKDLHRALALRALREGTSLNSYCARLLHGTSGTEKPIVAPAYIIHDGRTALVREPHAARCAPAKHKRPLRAGRSGPENPHSS